jgi:hypothetical protein
MQSRSLRSILAHRVVEASREIGVLLIAFSPLDFVLGEMSFRRSWPILASFMLVGFALLAASVLGEWRLQSWQGSS